MVSTSHQARDRLQLANCPGIPCSILRNDKTPRATHQGCGSVGRALSKFMTKLRRNGLTHYVHEALVCLSE